jgi:hypothetical protein
MMHFIPDITKQNRKKVKKVKTNRERYDLQAHLVGSEAVQTCCGFICSGGAG